MGKCGGLSRFLRKSHSSGMTTSQTSQDNDEHQPSTSSASASPCLDSLQTMDLRDLCEQVFALLRIIEDEGQENVEHTCTERPFRQRLACLPILHELFKQQKPDLSVLKPYFIKGENDANTLVYMIFREVPCEMRIAVGLLSVGASLENWVNNINQNMRKVCLDVFQKMCELGKLLHDMRYPMSNDQNLKQKLQQELRKGEELLVEGSIMCAFHVNGSYLTRYLQGCSYKESFMWFLSKLESVHKALCSWSESLIFVGVRSSPLSGRPNMNYPTHAVGIEREKQDIIKMLEWGSKRQTVAIIVSGQAGIGKSTLADAVFTSIHIPLCNYIRYTWFEGCDWYVKTEKWIRNYWEEKKKQNGNDVDIVENSENINDSDDESCEESEAAGDKEEEEDEDFQRQHGQFFKKHDYDHYGNDLVDLVFIESKVDAALDVCSFIYFDNPTGNLSEDLKYLLKDHKSSKQRIVVTTRDVEYAWKECKEVLNEDCMYNYIMLAHNEKVNELAKEKEIVTRRSRKTVQELEEIARSSLGHNDWQMLRTAASTSSHLNQDDDDISQVVLSIIEFCKGIPERLPVVCKYIAAAAVQGRLLSHLQYLLHISSSSSVGDSDNDDDAAKWENFMNLLMKQDFLTKEYMDGLQLLSPKWKFYSTRLHRWASWGCMAGLTRDVVEEEVLRILQEKGMVVADGRGSVRVPYPLCHYFIVTKPNYDHDQELASIIRSRRAFVDINDEIPSGLRYLHLEEMPSSCTWERVARLSSLRRLNLSLLGDDVKVPLEFCALPAISNTIRELHIHSPGLSELPQNFGQLRCLHILHLRRTKLKRLPEGFGMLSLLRQLWCRECVEMEELCSDFSNLGSLHTLGWITNGRLLPEKCWKEMVKLKRLTTLLLDKRLHDQSKTLPFPQRVSIYYHRRYIGDD